MYDARLGRWWGIDKLSGQFTWVSPYAYTLNNPVRLIEQEGKFPIDVHYAMVKKSLSKTTISTQTAKTIAYGASLHADAFSKKNLHLDNMSDFKSIAGGYGSAKIDFVKGMKLNDFIRAGEGLHTVADFYSHSNYISLYQTYASENKLSMEISDIPTFSEAINNPDLKGFVDVLKKELKTGTFGEGNVVKELIKDKHSKDENSHGQMNLDSPESPKGKLPYNDQGDTLYDAAKATAEKDIEKTVENY